MPHGFTEKEWAKAWRHELFENKVRGTQAKNVLINNGPQHYSNMWKEKEQQQRAQEEERKRQSQARQAERDRQAKIKQQQKLKREQAEREREDRARRWKHAQEETAKAKEKLEKENPPKKPKSKKPKPKTYTESLADNLKNDMLPDKGAPFDAHKVKLNIPGIAAQFAVTSTETYFEWKNRQQKVRNLSKKGFGSYKSPSEHFWGRTEEDDPMRGICERDNLKIAAEGLKKAVGTTIIGLFATKSPLAFVGGAFAGASAVIDETAKQDTKVRECEKNKKPKV